MFFRLTDAGVKEESFVFAEKANEHIPNVRHLFLIY